MKFKFGVKQIVLIVVAVVLAAILIAGNIILNANKLILNKLFSGLTQYSSEAGGEAYELGDAMVSQLVEDSAVLLRNEGDALPLDPDNANENKVNLFGWNATTDGFLLTGTGSGGSPVLDENRVTLAEAFTEAGYEYNATLLNDYASNSGANGDTINKYGQYSNNSMKAIHNPGASFYTDERMQQARNYSDVAIIVLSRNTGENVDNNETLNSNGYNNGAWLELTENEKIMLQSVTQKFADGKVIVLINTTNTMELGFLEEYNVDAALYIGAVGQSGARAIPHLLYGVKDNDGETVQVSPSGRTADTYAYSYNLVDGKNYSASWTSAISNTNGGNNNSLYYQEGIYIGYKWYETADEEGFFDAAGGYDAIVQYPFGYGLSYTEFSWTVEEWPESNSLTEDGKYEVKVRVQNIGEYAGKDVVELYYTPKYYNGEIEKASMNLLAFGKTVTLDPGETQLITLSFTAYDLASYDDYDKNNNNVYGYELDPGDHEIKLMTDAHHAAKCYDSNEKEISNVFTMSCAGVEFETDPVTGTEVENLFTGNTAYSGTPIDGSTVFDGGIEYLSRKDGFANFPSETTFTCVAPKTSPSQTYSPTAWNNADVSDIAYGQDAGLYLVTKEDGSKASSSDLSSSKSALKYNVALMETLWDYDAPEWTAFLNQLSQSDISSLIRQGQFQTVALESVGKPYCNEFDGPAGFNRNSVAGSKSESIWVVFPAEILLGCSWNPQSTYNMGKAMGVIAHDNENSETLVHGWYGPGLNLHRSPYYGRNFEYYSEDAVLTGKLAAECIRGAKENDLTCYMKHFVCADSGPNSPNWYTWLTEQNLRENYLRPFEIAVKEGGANAVMSGFSAVGSMWAGANYALSTQILRNEWGFRGSMITDWYNNYMDLTRGILSGNDLWLGDNSSTISYSNNAQAYCARQSAKNILYTYIDCYMTAYEYQQKVASGEFDDPYAVNVDKPMVGNSTDSALFMALWAILDVLLILGVAACVVFIIFTPAQIAQLFKGKKAAVAADGGSAPEPEAAPEAESVSAPEAETPADEADKDQPENPEGD